jgi:putative MATE family efflux protein
MVSSKQLEEGKISSLIVKFSGPAIVGMIVMSIYNIVDRIFIGRSVGALGLAGLTIGFPLMILVMGMTMLIAIGASALISIRLGQKREDEAQQVMGNAFTLLILTALVVTVTGLFLLNPILITFGASEVVLPYASGYMRIILYGTIFSVLSMGMNNFIRAEGNPKIAMVTMMIGAGINIILDYIFIFILGMGVAGAAWATIIAQAASATWVLSYFLGDKSLLNLYWKNLRLRFDLVQQIVTVGTPVFIQQTSTSLIIVFTNNTLFAYGGDLAISAFGIVHSIFTLLLMPIFGISQGTQPIIGYNYGAQKYDRVKQTIRLAAVISTGIAVFGFVGIMLFSELLAQLFSTDRALIALAAEALRTFLFMLPVLGFQIVGATYFQAVGKPKQAVILNLSRQVLFFLPALIVLPRYFDLKGVWLVGPVADFLAFLLTAGWLLAESRYLDKKEQEFHGITN